MGSRIHTPLKLNAIFSLSDPFDSYNIKRGLRLNLKVLEASRSPLYVATAKWQACNIVPGPLGLMETKPKRRSDLCYLPPRSCGHAPVEQQLTPKSASCNGQPDGTSWAKALDPNSCGSPGEDPGAPKRPAPSMGKRPLVPSVAGVW